MKVASCNLNSDFCWTPEPVQLSLPGPKGYAYTYGTVAWASNGFDQG